jgi:tryptophanyl-tRNA synthetase
MARNFRAGGYGYGHAKKALFEIYERTFAPFRAKREEMEKNLDYVEEILRKGAERAREEAAKTMDKVRKAVGY